MTHYAYSLISGRLVCRPFSAAADNQTIRGPSGFRLESVPPHVTSLLILPRSTSWPAPTPPHQSRSVPMTGGDSPSNFAVLNHPDKINATVTLRRYIDSSEMSIVGPPPRTPGGRFFLTKKNSPDSSGLYDSLCLLTHIRAASLQTI